MEERLQKYMARCGVASRRNDLRWSNKSKWFSYNRSWN